MSDDYESQNPLESSLNSPFRAIGRNILVPDEVFYTDSMNVDDVVDHFEASFSRSKGSISATAVLDEDYDMRSQALNGEEYVKGDLAYTFFEMIHRAHVITTMMEPDLEDFSLDLRAESDYAEMRHLLEGDEAQQIFLDAAEEVPPEVREHSDSEFDTPLSDKNLIESQAEKYFQKYAEDVEFREKKI